MDRDTTEMRGLKPQSSLTETVEDHVELLEGKYTFSNALEVKKLLLTHDHLIDPLLEAHKQIKRVFQENIVEVFLEHDRDPEENFEGLSVIVKTNLSPEQSLNLLDQLDEKWWLDVDSEIRMALTIMVRPVEL